MCGFTGTLSFEDIDNTKLKKSNEHSICRGPDNLSNVIGSEDINYDLWFNRLSIVDLSDKANQPMLSENSNSIVMFNGEIYNSKILREKISKTKYNFKSTHSDTETLFAGLETYGIDFINDLEGQFSFFYLDKRKKKIYFTRDRVGQKPLYISMSKKSISFASNLKSILELNGKYKLDPKSLSQYIAYGAIFSPKTLFNDIYKVKPANYIEVDYSKGEFENTELEYWNTESYLDNKRFVYEEFQNLLSESVEKRMIADVPIANFLSGGIDSTSIVKKLVDSNFKVNTFSVIIKNNKYNEKKYIDQVVNKYKTNHHEVFVDENISNNVIMSAISSLDEPYADPSVVPSYYLSKLISSKYKVAISGDGGDELLGGYFRIKNHLNKKNIINNKISHLYSIYPAFLGSGTKLKSKSRDISESYLAFLEDEKFHSYVTQKNLSTDLRMKVNNIGPVYKSLLGAEYKYYLSDQMMFKVDRSSMSNSLEVRSPFVDHKLIEYIFSHSSEYFNNKQKYPLYKFLSDDFDRGFLDRPKQGFVFDYKINPKTRKASRKLSKKNVYKCVEVIERI